MIGFLDRAIFRENPAAFNFGLKENQYGLFVGFIQPRKGEKERSYQIEVKNLAGIMEKEVNMINPLFTRGGQLQDVRRYLPDLAIAAHEVRHRVQHDRKVRRFSPESAKLVKNKILQSIIKFQEMVFKEDEKIYRRDKKPERFIKDRLGPKEFDAKVIERLISNRLYEISKRENPKIGPADLEEFASMI